MSKRWVKSILSPHLVIICLSGLSVHIFVVFGCCLTAELTETDAASWGGMSSNDEEVFPIFTVPLCPTLLFSLHHPTLYFLSETLAVLLSYPHSMLSTHQLPYLSAPSFPPLVLLHIKHHLSFLLVTTHRTLAVKVLQSRNIKPERKGSH